jgi:hypothetical protein
MLVSGSRGRITSKQVVPGRDETVAVRAIAHFNNLPVIIVGMRKMPIYEFMMSIQPLTSSLAAQ